MPMPRRFQSLSRMFLTLFVALAACLLLEAEGLRTWAERLEVGPLRSVALPASEAWHTLLDGSGAGLARREALALKAEWADVLLPHVAADARAPVAGPEESAPAPVVADAPALPAASAQSLPAPAGAPVLPGGAPLIVGVPASAPQIVLAGDSMMAVGLAPVLRRGLGMQVIKAYRSGTGLARPEVFDWLVQYPQMIGQARPALVICALGANDGQNVQIGKDVLEFGSPDWDAFYRGRLTAYLDMLTKDGRKVLWVGLPVMRSASFARKMRHMNALIQDVLKAYPQVSWLDPNPVLSAPDASFAQYKADSRGRMIKMRADDGIHMTDDGAAFLLPDIRHWLSANLGAGSAGLAGL